MEKRLEGNRKCLIRWEFYRIDKRQLIRFRKHNKFQNFPFCFNINNILWNIIIFSKTKLDCFAFCKYLFFCFSFLLFNVWLKKTTGFSYLLPHSICSNIMYPLENSKLWEYEKEKDKSYYYYKCNFYIMELLKIYPVSSKVSRVHFENTKFIVSFPLWVMVGWLGITNKYSTHIHIYTPCIFYKQMD